MTDHAELRRRAGLASGGNWYGEDSQVLVGKHAIAYCNHKLDAQFIGEANPKTILALLDEIDGMKASGWRNHSVNYARAEKCPQTLETAQAAWDRDQELIEEQRQQIARDSQTINQLRQKLQSAEVDRDRLKAESDRLRQGMKGDYDIDAWLDWSKEKEQIKAENDALQGALHAVQAEVDGNLRPLTRDLVNMVSGLNNGSHPNDIYEHCDEIERIIGAALEGAKP
ncbi:TPA: hypothetical protein ACGJ1X_003933 [Pseudomonas aeruginosa]|uniref:hypothetical protein n=1 Tax=Pseudomonas aeruginosa TaxID=287 RepID=UPI00068E80BC|nr:hypothetical protein [Pseudomonas aeruginosa]